MKVSELEGADLDYWVAKAEGYRPLWWEDHWFVLLDKGAAYRPSTDWSQGGPIIEREQITLEAMGDEWRACQLHVSDRMIVDRYDYGPTPLIAAMRCFVVSTFGETVDSAVTKAK